MMRRGPYPLSLSVSLVFLYPYLLPYLIITVELRGGEGLPEREVEGGGSRHYPSIVMIMAVTATRGAASYSLPLKILATLASVSG